MSAHSRFSRAKHDRRVKRRKFRAGQLLRHKHRARKLVKLGIVRTVLDVPAPKSPTKLYKGRQERDERKARRIPRRDRKAAQKAAYERKRAREGAK